jgi:hypothetical protein
MRRPARGSGAGRQASGRDSSQEGPSRQATRCDETLRLGFHQPDQTAEALAVFEGKVPEREETDAMFDYPALAFNQESPDARG